MFWNNTIVKIIKEIDTTDKWWCSSAVMFSVKNGKGTICEKYAPENEDYECFSQMLINGKPLAQSVLPDCPTCKGMLAAGYGIENVECPELKTARECMNSGFVNIMDSVEKIKPLLGLLSDGYYALADTICLPSDGEGNFFYDVPDKLTRFESLCDDYYCNWNLCCTGHFPLFLYPTQSSSLINNERVDHYVKILNSDKNPPRALAYHYCGFMSLLLDGHHKACAAASLGKYVRCLTIIPADGCMFAPEEQIRGVDIRKSNPRIRTISFAGLETEAEADMRYLDIYGNRQQRENMPPFEKYDLNGTEVRYGPGKYPTLRDIIILLDAGEEDTGTLPEVDQEVVRAMLNEDTEKADRYLEAAISYLAVTDHHEAYKLASAIVKKGDGRMRHGRVRSALLFLLGCHSDETEQLFVDYQLNHEEQDENWHIANSYWKAVPDRLARGV